MQKYELVFMLNSQVKDSERKDFLSKFEEEFKKNILQKDDIGLKETSYDVKSIGETIECIMFPIIWT